MPTLGTLDQALYATFMEEEERCLYSGSSSSIKLIPGPNLHQGPGKASLQRPAAGGASGEGVGCVGRESWRGGSCG